jgi:hypothetical protein
VVVAVAVVKAVAVDVVVVVVKAVDVVVVVAVAVAEYVAVAVAATGEREALGGRRGGLSVPKPPKGVAGQPSPKGRSPFPPRPTVPPQKEMAGQPFGHPAMRVNLLWS